MYMAFDDELTGNMTSGIREGSKNLKCIKKSFSGLNLQ
jgi:hypothetical protein